MVHAHFSTAGGELRGNGDGDRGAMFRTAMGADELRFTFFRSDNSDNRNSGDTVEVGFTATQDVDIYRSIEVGPSVLLTLDARQPMEISTYGFRIHAADGQVISRWDLQDQIQDNLWYDGVIQLLTDSTVIFGYRLSGAPAFIYSTGHELPSGFVANYIGVTAYRVPPSEGATGVAKLDNVGIVPEPSSLALCFVWCQLAYRRRRW
jgi:hypothetical protein